jgi:hypothetical protein
MSQMGATHLHIRYHYYTHTHTNFDSTHLLGTSIVVWHHNTVNFKWVSFPPTRPSCQHTHIHTHTRVATCMYICSYTYVYASLCAYVYLACRLFGNYVCDPPYTQLPTLLPSCMHVGCVSVHTLSRTSRGGEETRGEGQ